MSLVKHKFRLKDGTQKESTDWYFRFTHKGKVHFGSTGTSNKTLAAKVEKKKLDGAVARTELGIVDGVTVHLALDTYLQTKKKSGQYLNILTNINKLMGTKKDNRSVEREAITIFGFDRNRRFDSLTSADAELLVQNRLKEGNSKGTILTELSYFNQAIKLNKRLKNPVPVIDFAELKKANQLKPSKKKLRYMTPDEEARILVQLDPATYVRGSAKGALSDHDVLLARQDVYDFVTCLFGLGGRYSEVAELPWADVDMKTKTITLYRTKVDNESVFHMTDRMIEVLARRHSEKRSGQKYVFENQAKDGPRNYAPQSFRTACKRAGVENVTYHSIRRTFASRLVQAGIPLYDVSQLLGHSDIQTTQAHYAHLAPNQSSKNATDVLNKINGDNS